MTTIRIKRVYEDATPDDGRRILVDRLWPRGVSKERAAVERWVRDLAPSDALRKEYGHDPAGWDDFRTRYFAELDARPEAVEELLAAIRGADRVTLVFASKEPRLNNAAALEQYLRARL